MSTFLQYILTLDNPTIGRLVDVHVDSSTIFQRVNRHRFNSFVLFPSSLGPSRSNEAPISIKGSYLIDKFEPIADQVKARALEDGEKSGQSREKCSIRYRHATDIGRLSGDTDTTKVGNVNRWKIMSAVWSTLNSTWKKHCQVNVDKKDICLLDTEQSWKPCFVQYLILRCWVLTLRK